MSSITFRRQQRRRRTYQYYVALADISSQESLVPPLPFNRRERVFRDRGHPLDSYSDSAGTASFGTPNPAKQCICTVTASRLGAAVLCYWQIFLDNRGLLWCTRVDSLPKSEQGYSGTPSTFYEVHSVGIAHFCAK